MEMILPFLKPWMKKFSDHIIFRIDSGQVAPLVKIAIDTRQAEVRFLIASAMFPGADVFDVKGGQRRVILV